MYAVLLQACDISWCAYVHIKWVCNMCVCICIFLYIFVALLCCGWGGVYKGNDHNDKPWALKLQ